MADNNKAHPMVKRVARSLLRDATTPHYYQRFSRWPEIDDKNIEAYRSPREGSAQAYWEELQALFEARGIAELQAVKGLLEEELAQAKRDFAEASQIEEADSVRWRLRIVRSKIIMTQKLAIINKFLATYAVQGGTELSEAAKKQLQSTETEAKTRWAIQEIAAQVESDGRGSYKAREVTAYLTQYHAQPSVSRNERIDLACRRLLKKEHQEAAKRLSGAYDAARGWEKRLDKYQF